MAGALCRVKGATIGTFCERGWEPLGENPSAIKNPSKRGIYGWGGRIRTSEMPGPKPGALPLGDAPMDY